MLSPPPAKDGVRLTQAPLTVRDAQGRVLVTVYANRSEPFADVRDASVRAGLELTTAVRGERAIEGFVAVHDIRTLARTNGVASVSQALRPRTNVGAATSQGVAAHRADRLAPGVDGRGVTVAALSDSFDVATQTVGGDPLTVHAAQDIASGDLPAEGVTVLEDLAPGQGGADEGRAMLQLVHDVAPGARQCFATAFTGDLGFAANIRRLADPAGPCQADVIVDDVSYFDEPFFGRGPISDAVDAVAAAGVHYFSSAGNGSAQQAYASPLRLVPAARAGEGTNLDFSQVDPALYAGGVQDFDASDAVDTAQDLVLGGDPTSESGAGDGIIDLQWDDPVDPDGATLGEPLLSTTGELTVAAPVASILFEGTAGQTVQGTADAIPSGSTDLILTLKDPSGRVLQRIDTGTSPELLVQTLPVTGTYTWEVSGFEGDLGDFTFEVRPVVAPAKTTTDLNALVFTADGRFLFAVSDLNRLSGKPFEIAGFEGRGALQLVIAKANAEGGEATQFRYQLYDGLQYTEDAQPLAPSAYGHSIARGATSVAAYDPFRPLLPETFTSVGGDLPILFDSDGNRLPEPDVRRAPQVAATDGGNTTFFTADSPLDPDTQPNFFGTSAAAPHAAAIGALALQAAGGPDALRPDELRALLERSAFRHDLDVQHSEASKRGLALSADGETGYERRTTRPEWTNPGSMDDPNVFKVSYRGRGSVVALTLDGLGADPTGLGEGPGGRSAGLVFDPRPFLGLPALGAPPLWQQGFPFTVGALSPGIAPGDVSATFDVPGWGAATAEQYRRMTVRIAEGRLADGRSIAFGIDRDEAVSAYGTAEGGNSADQLGPGVLFPSGEKVGPGMRYAALLSTGRTISGTFRNRIGAGWTPVDGYGFLNAQAAVRRVRR